MEAGHCRAVSDVKLYVHSPNEVLGGNRHSSRIPGGNSVGKLPVCHSVDFLGGSYRGVVSDTAVAVYIDKSGVNFRAAEIQSLTFDFSYFNNFSVLYGNIHGFTEERNVLNKLHSLVLSSKARTKSLHTLVVLFYLSCFFI